MVPAGDTWGISGSQFLLVYALLAVAVTVAAVRMRRALADVPAGHSVGRPDDRPYDVAYLNGGAELALCAALSAMHRSETIALWAADPAFAGELAVQRAAYIGSGGGSGDAGSSCGGGGGCGGGGCGG